MSDQQNSGMGCFLKGCLTLLVVGLLMAAMAVGGFYYFYDWTVKNFTADAPVTVRSEQPTDAQYNEAAKKLNGIQNALNVGHENSFEFTAGDLNALVARHPRFAALRGKVFFTINNSDIGCEISAPTDAIPFAKFKGRHFNGRIITFLEYFSGQLTLRPKLIEANGKTMPPQLMEQMFRDQADLNARLRENKETAAAMDQLKSVRVTANTIVITTKLGPGLNSSSNEGSTENK